MEHLDVFRTRNSCLGKGGSRVDVDDIRISAGSHLLEEVLVDETWEAWVADVLPKAVKVMGVFCS